MWNDKVFVIAEAGVNHNGSLDLAKKLIDVAVAVGADAIKFQMFKAENLVSKNAEKAAYQISNTGNNETQFAMLKRLEFDMKAHQELMQYCKVQGILFLSSAFDLESIVALAQLDLPIFKIPSGEIDNLSYLKEIGRLNKKVILSTGMSVLADIAQALTILTSSGTDINNIVVLHCNTEYPTPMQDVNLRAMLSIKDAFKVNVGYSDHTLGIEVPIAAVALGARVIEKHFTLDKNMDGPDHKASLEPDELKAMIAAIRNVELALGDGVKKLSPSEIKNKLVVRKSIVAKTSIKKGEVFTEANLTVKRPAHGRSPMLWDEILGQVAQKNYQEDECI